MDDFGRFGGPVVVGQIEWRQQVGIERFVVSVLETFLFFHDRLPEVHEDDPLVRLGDAILQPGRDTQFLRLHRENQRGLKVFWDDDVIEPHQAAERRGNDSAGTGQSDLPGNVRRVSNREVPIVKADGAARAEIDEFFYGGLDQANAPVVAVQADVVGQVVDGVEQVLVVPAPDDFQIRPFV